MPENPPKSSPDAAESRHGLAALLRLVWMMCPVALLACGMTIARVPAWTFGVRDGVFWALVAVMGVARYLDVTRFDGQTANGERATTTDLWRYLVGLTAASLVVWLGAQSNGF